MIHITRHGETLRRISARYYGDWTIWPLIADSNHLDRREPLTVGRAIEIPEPRFIGTEHTIVDGDSYELLALMYYGSEHFADKIKLANPDKIIYESVGLRFVIPPLVDRTTLISMGVFRGT